MPTADDFERAAANLRNLSGELEEFAYPLERSMGGHVLEGGELTDSVYETIKAARLVALAVSGIVDEYAAEATRRQEEAVAAAKARKEWAEDLRQYKKDKAIYDQVMAGEKVEAGPFKIRIDPDEVEEPVHPGPEPEHADYIDL